MDNGRRQTLKALSGRAAGFADAFVIGASDEVLTSDANNLGFPWARFEITGSYINGDEIVYFGRVPAEVSGTIKEIGLYAFSPEYSGGGTPDSILFTMTDGEGWFSEVVYDYEDAGLVGDKNIIMTDVSVGDILGSLIPDSNISNVTNLKLLVESSAVTGVTVRLKNDDSNYIERLYTVVDGLNNLDFQISTFTETGDFDPKNLSGIELEIASVSSSTNSISFDSISLIDKNQGGLVFRNIPSEAVIKRPGSTMEIECVVKLGV